jgi:hypothetical protein
LSWSPLELGQKILRNTPVIFQEIFVLYVGKQKRPELKRSGLEGRGIAYLDWQDLGISRGVAIGFQCG